MGKLGVPRKDRGVKRSSHELIDGNGAACRCSLERERARKLVEKGEASLEGEGRSISS